MKNLFLLVVWGWITGVQAQVIEVRTVNNRSGRPDLCWQAASRPDTTAFRIFRAPVRDKRFTEIHTLHYTEPFPSGDSVMFHVIDTTLTAKGIYLYYIQAPYAGQTVTSATAMGHNLGLIPRPRLIRFKAEPLTDRKAVRLSWQLNYSPTVNILRLYRSKNYEDGYVRIAELNPSDTTYIDRVPKANEPWFYFIEILNYFGGTDRSVRLPAFATYKEKPFPPVDMNVTRENGTVTFQWRNVGDNVVGYHVYRSVNERPFRLMHEMIPVGTDENIRFVDSSGAVRRAQRLRYYVRHVSDGFVESNITDTIDLYLPENQPVYPPPQADYVRGPGEHIKFLWMPDKRGLNLAFNLYLQTPADSIRKLNAEPLYTNAYETDTYTWPEGRYVFWIEAVGINGKRSARQTPVTFTVMHQPPAIHLDISRADEGFLIRFNMPAGYGLHSVVLYKQSGRNKPVRLANFSGEGPKEFYDKNVRPRQMYTYFLTAVSATGKEIRNGHQVDVRF